MTLTLKTVMQFFPQDTLAYAAVLSDQAWLQTDQQFRRYNTISHFFYISISPHCDLDTEHSVPIFLHDTLAYDAA